MRVILNIDGGARGNPGPAAAGFVIRSDDGEQVVLRQAGVFLGNATNNVAEYSGLLAGLEAAKQLGAAEVTVISDSELLVRQMTGVYRVRNAGLIPLVSKARDLEGQFSKVHFKHVPREQNKLADKLVNQAIDGRRNVEE